ncbi:hypothetical protein AURDEDRAFT_127919 [Auricularia subglabra TFB-10046 SS5]|nr:hypothetical protein AURDEDRAFT_127919 [Auricularia subglabra TFB-10046 SS5]
MQATSAVRPPAFLTGKYYMASASSDPPHRLGRGGALDIMSYGLKRLSNSLPNGAETSPEHSQPAPEKSPPVTCVTSRNEHGSPISIALPRNGYSRMIRTSSWAKFHCTSHRDALVAYPSGTSSRKALLPLTFSTTSELTASRGGHIARAGRGDAESRQGWDEMGYSTCSPAGSPTSDKGTPERYGGMGMYGPPVGAAARIPSRNAEQAARMDGVYPPASAEGFSGTTTPDLEHARTVEEPRDVEYGSTIPTGPITPSPALDSPSSALQMLPGDSTATDNGTTHTRFPAARSRRARRPVGDIYRTALSSESFRIIGAHLKLAGLRCLRHAQAGTWRSAIRLALLLHRAARLERRAWERKRREMKGMDRALARARLIYWVLAFLPTYLPTAIGYGFYRTTTPDMGIVGAPQAVIRHRPRLHSTAGRVSESTAASRPVAPGAARARRGPPPSSVPQMGEPGVSSNILAPRRSWRARLVSRCPRLRSVTLLKINVADLSCDLQLSVVTAAPLLDVELIHDATDPGLANALHSTPSLNQLRTFAFPRADNIATAATLPLTRASCAEGQVSFSVLLSGGSLLMITRRGSVLLELEGRCYAYNSGNTTRELIVPAFRDRRDSDINGHERCAVGVPALDDEDAVADLRWQNGPFATLNAVNANQASPSTPLLPTVNVAVEGGATLVLFSMRFSDECPHADTPLHENGVSERLFSPPRQRKRPKISGYGSAPIRTWLARHDAGALPSNRGAKADCPLRLGPRTSDRQALQCFLQTFAQSGRPCRLNMDRKDEDGARNCRFNRLDAIPMPRRDLELRRLSRLLMAHACLSKTVSLCRQCAVPPRKLVALSLRRKSQSVWHRRTICDYLRRQQLAVGTHMSPKNAAVGLPLVKKHVHETVETVGRGSAVDIVSSQ